MRSFRKPFWLKATARLHEPGMHYPTTRSDYTIAFLRVAAQVEV